VASSVREHASDPTEVHLVALVGPLGVEYRGPYASLRAARGVVTRLKRSGYARVWIVRAVEWETVE
jgi:hypothetical protein